MLKAAMQAGSYGGAPEQDHIRPNAHLVSSGHERLEVSAASLHHEQEWQGVFFCRSIGGGLRHEEGLRVTLRIGWQALEVQIGQTRAVQEVCRGAGDHSTGSGLCDEGAEQFAVEAGSSRPCCVIHGAGNVSQVVWVDERRRYVRGLRPTRGGGWRAVPAWVARPCGGEGPPGGATGVRGPSAEPADASPSASLQCGQRGG